jgi:thiamine-monophosphate kinase
VLELDLLREIENWVIRDRQRGTNRLLLGIGDDCALYRPRPNEDLVFTTDFLIEGTHFRRDTHPPTAIGHKALARSLSDLAAMGAQPQFCLLSLALPDGETPAFIRSFFQGFLTLARRTKTQLAGGDLSRANQLVCDVMACGSVPKGRELRRSGARPGDLLCVSGRLGKPWQKHLKPEPRLELGRALRGRATSAIDLSDGLSLDLRRLCVASQVAAVIDQVPVQRGSTLELALHGGEDYELLFTLPAKMKPPAGVTNIGLILEGPPGEVYFQGAPLTPAGYQHSWGTRK